jgi:glucose/arabinose dehydrogenase
LGKNSTWNNYNGFVNSTYDANEPPAGIVNGKNLEDFLNADSQSHTIGSVRFGSDGKLYVSNGDGISFNRVDERAVRVQDIDNLSGKLLRIDPLTGEGLSDNPFYNGDPDSNRSKVYQYGLRNPFRFTIDPRNNRLYVGDVGWTKWEEINSSLPGANFGWPYYEGGNGVSLKNAGYQDLLVAREFYNSGQTVTPALLAISHKTGIDALILGDFYLSNIYPDRYKGDLFFNDLDRGIVQNISFDRQGKISALETFTTGVKYIVQIAIGPDGNLYYVDLDDGSIGRWRFV